MKLSAASYPIWTGVVRVGLQPFEYKYIRKTPGRPVVWEGYPYVNRSASVGAEEEEGDAKVEVHDAWF